MPSREVLICLRVDEAVIPPVPSFKSVSCAARAFGSRITVRSNPRACVGLAAPLRILKSVSPTRTD